MRLLSNIVVGSAVFLCSCGGFRSQLVNTHNLIKDEVVLIHKDFRRECFKEAARCVEAGTGKDQCTGVQKCKELRNSFFDKAKAAAVALKELSDVHYKVDSLGYIKSPAK